MNSEDTQAKIEGCIYGRHQELLRNADNCDTLSEDKSPSSLIENSELKPGDEYELTDSQEYTKFNEEPSSIAENAPDILDAKPKSLDSIAKVPVNAAPTRAFFDASKIPISRKMKEDKQAKLDKKAKLEGRLYRSQQEQLKNSHNYGISKGEKSPSSLVENSQLKAGDEYVRNDTSPKYASAATNKDNDALKEMKGINKEKKSTGDKSMQPGAVFVRGIDFDESNDVDHEVKEIVKSNDMVPETFTVPNATLVKEESQRPYFDVGDITFATSVELVPGWKKYQKSIFACILAGIIGIALSIYYLAKPSMEPVQAPVELPSLIKEEIRNSTNMTMILNGITSSDFNDKTRADWENITSEHIELYHETRGTDAIDIKVSTNLIEIYNISDGVQMFYEQQYSFKTSDSSLRAEDFLINFPFLTSDGEKGYISKMKEISDAFENVTKVEVDPIVDPPTNIPTEKPSISFRPTMLYYCSLCPGGEGVPNPDLELSLGDDDFGDLTCGFYETTAQFAADEEACTDMQTYLGAACRCPSALVGSCTLCSGGENVPNPDLDISLDDYYFTCGDYELLAMTTVTDEEECIEIQTYLGALCGCPGDGYDNTYSYIASTVCPFDGSTAFCCDDDGSCYDGDDDWCCDGEFYCSNDGAAYAEEGGGILCPVVTTETLTILEICQMEPMFSTFVSLFVASGLAELLSSTGPFTLFVPTNDVFANPLYDDVIPFLNSDVDALKDFMLYHVVNGTILSTYLVSGDITSLEGSNLTVSLDSKIGNEDIDVFANIIGVDIVSSNGVVHVIGDLLTPTSVYQTFIALNP